MIPELTDDALKFILWIFAAFALGALCGMAVPL